MENGVFMYNSFDYWCYKLMCMMIGESCEVREYSPHVLSFGIIGMAKSGKTQLYRSLQDKKYNVYEMTQAEQYEEFYFLTKDRIVAVPAGWDIGGDEGYIQQYYGKFLDEKDIVIFVFDVRRYLEEPLYQRDVRDRLEYIWRRLDAKSDIKTSVKLTSECVKKKFILLGSHFDQLLEQQKQEVINLLHESVKGKAYGELFYNNMYVVDLRDRKLLFDIFEKSKIYG